MITKVLGSAVVAVGVGALAVAPASADPYECRASFQAASFCGLSQSAPPEAGPAVTRQINQGIQQGFSDLHATQGRQ